MGVRERRKGADFERAIAKIFGVERAGTKGKADKDHADIEHPTLYIQCKIRQSIAACRWLDKTIEESPEDKIPIVICREDRGKSFIMMDLDDFLQFYGMPYVIIDPREDK